MKKCLITISWSKKEGYSVHIKDKDKDEDVGKVVLEDCHNLRGLLEFCIGLKNILGEISVIFALKRPKGKRFHFDSGRTAASIFIAS